MGRALGWSGRSHHQGRDRRIEKQKAGGQAEGWIGALLAPMRRIQRYIRKPTRTKAAPPIMMPAVSKSGPTNASGAPLPEKAAIAVITTRITLSPTIRPEANNTPNCFVSSGLDVRLARRSKIHPTTAPTTIINVLWVGR